MTTLVREAPLTSSELSASGIAAKFKRLKNPSVGMALVALLSVVVACCIVMILWSVTVKYRPIYGAQENFDSAQVIEVLEAEGIRYQISPKDGTILVADDSVGKIRMMMAARGIQARLPSGYDGFQGDMTSSQFMEQARYRQALEGELARTIMGLQQVRTARVHLAIPKAQVFMRKDDPKPTASVLLELEQGSQLARAQVTGIVNLVAGSITGLTTSAVRVVDQQGQLLSGSGNADALGLSEHDTHYQQQLERTLIERASSMLEPLVGFGNYRVQISAQVNFDKVDETRELLDPNTVLTQESSNSTSRTLPNATGVPGALANMPIDTGIGEDESGAVKSVDVTNQDEQLNRQFEVGRTVSRVRKQRGDLESLSVSVLLNQQVVNELALQPAQVASIETMIKDAVGFSVTRDDQFSMASLPFRALEPIEVQPTVWWHESNNQAYIRIAIGIVLTLLMLFVVVKPLVRSITRSHEKQQDGKAESAASPATMPASVGNAVVAAASEASPDQLELQQNLAQIPLVPASDATLDVQLEHLGLLAEQAPEKVAEVIELMLNGEDR
ncbi:flagellar basal-body MS-ring/collar protein FliF [Ferrimonas lipolytica]|uniref:Flagellar M-ring protein n=1 Tax=Ferrimonas lipolytica TaxID=2724191 RepID=A0A6H1UD88_9GAMM|nr:flagellar basal-body MS-ring/collar protein FliF [Ferrimonas lipolytica]QIZ76808.1 flagellar M-ring protein FliF [Ferrimonas lipolytica]